MVTSTNTTTTIRPRTISTSIEEGWDVLFKFSRYLIIILKTLFFFMKNDSKE